MRDIREEDSFLGAALFREDVIGSLMFRNGLGEEDSFLGDALFREDVMGSLIFRNGFSEGLGRVATLVLGVSNEGIK